MNMDNHNWLTITEVVEKSNCSDIEARRILKKFGKFLAPRNFGDIVKYPPAAVEAITLIGELYRQGCSNEEITAILIRKEETPQESVMGDLQREVKTLLMLQSQAYQLLRSTFEMVQGLMSDVAILTVKLVAAEGEIKNLKEEQEQSRASVDNRRLEYRRLE
jgi:DNA-binding transcriptional MerR regulator